MNPHHTWRRWMSRLSLDRIVVCLVVSVFIGHQAAGMAVASQAPVGDPHLVLEAGGHQAIIRQLLFTDNGAELVSVSDDKTIRVWSVSPDGRQATLARTIRGQIEDGRAGQLFAAALSPPETNGRQQRLAVGGYLSGPPADRFAIRLHDYASGDVNGLLRGHTNNVDALAFHPSGRWLASASKDHTIRIWDLSSVDRNAAIDSIVLGDHTDRVVAVAWSPDGSRLASASFDCTVGLWNTESLRKRNVRLINRLRAHSEWVLGVAFHPEGTVLASGGNDQSIHLWRATDGKDLGNLTQADHKISALSFSPDGKQIIAGNFSPPQPKAVTLFSYPSGNEQHRFTGHDNLTLAAAFHPSGQWLATGGGNRKNILLWRAADGEILSRLEGKGGTIYAVGFSEDGRAIGWGHISDYTSINDRGPIERLFDLHKLEPIQTTIDGMRVVRAQTRVGDVSLAVENDGDSRLEVNQGWKRLSEIDLKPESGLWHSAFSFTPDGLAILSGSQNGELRLYSPDGRPRARLVGHTGMITALAVSADGRWALSGANDQTLRLWDLKALPAGDGAELAPTLSLFPTVDGEWIAWTPEGFFAASAHGARQVGYTVNRGVDHTADFVSVDQLYDRFYRPDLVHARLHGDAAGLWQKKDAAADVKTVIDEGLAPRVAFVDPTTNRAVDGQSVDVQANIVDQGGGIGKVVWKINDTTVAADSPAGSAGARLAGGGDAATGGVITLKQQFSLLPGENTIQLLAYNRRNEIASSPALLTLTLTPPAPAAPPLPAAAETSPAPPASAPSPTAEAPAIEAPADATPVVAAAPEATAPAAAEPGPSIGKDLLASIVKKAPLAYPSLHVMVVGINRYRDKDLQLKYAVQDGKAIADTIRRTAAPLFQDVHVTPLFDDQVTLKGLDQAFQQVREGIAPRDVFVFYLAGHGVTLDGRYYFLPHDFRYTSEDAVRRDAVNQDHLQAWLAGIPARKSLVLIDTCESGSFSQSMVAMRGMAEKAAIAKLTRATGRATIVASTDTQPAAEGYQGHGVFTYVLLEGLRHADATFGNRDGYTGLFELAAYVNDQVPTITMNAFNFEQIPQVNLVGTDFPIGVVTATES